MFGTSSGSRFKKTWFRIRCIAIVIRKIWIDIGTQEELEQRERRLKQEIKQKGELMNKQSKLIGRISVSLSLCLSVSLYLCLSVSLSLCFFVFLSFSICLLSLYILFHPGVTFSLSLSLKFSLKLENYPSFPSIPQFNQKENRGKKNQEKSGKITKKVWVWRLYGITSQNVSEAGRQIKRKGERKKHTERDTKPV